MSRRSVNCTTEPDAIGENDGKLARLKELLAGDLKGKKVLIFSSFKDTHPLPPPEADGRVKCGVAEGGGQPAHPPDRQRQPPERASTNPGPFRPGCEREADPGQ